MRKIMLLAAIVALAAAGLAMSGEGEEDAVKIKVGETAPDFSLPGSDGKTHTLAEHLGERAVVIAWFPKAFTGG